MPSLALTDFIFQTFSISHYMSNTIHGLTKNGNRKITENVLQKYLNKVVNFARLNPKTGELNFQRELVSIFFIIMSKKEPINLSGKTKLKTLKRDKELLKHIYKHGTFLAVFLFLTCTKVIIC